MLKGPPMDGLETLATSSMSKTVAYRAPWTTARTILLAWFSLTVTSTLPLLGQTDSLVFKNGDVMVGEIKSMDRGIAVVETKYSDTDFKITWLEVRRVFAKKSFVVTTSDNRQYFGSLHSISDGKVSVRTAAGDTAESTFEDVVYLNPVEGTFLQKLSATIDIGFSLTKANNLKQFTIGSAIGYNEQGWSTDVVLNSLNSTQDNVEPIQRTEGTVNYRNNFTNAWYAMATLSALTNTEQKLDLRFSAQLVGARYLVRTNRGYLGVKAGVNRNIEKYSSATGDRTTWEGVLGAELNVYNSGDLKLVTTAASYPSFTESGRWRVDINCDGKYDLPLDFYIKLGVSFNYDNRPAAGATSTDYVFQTGFGWEW
jgi:hypothetical protein